jgi:hypothetical protein
MAPPKCILRSPGSPPHLKAQMPPLNTSASAKKADRQIRARLSFHRNSLAVRSKLLSVSYSPIIERPTGQPFTESTGIVTCGAPA